MRFEPILVRTVRGSMERKIDSRWALIRENETDLIFVDENEIIYPKRINADKGNLVIFLVFKIMLDFDWFSSSFLTIMTEFSWKLFSGKVWSLNFFG